ncbi:MAG: bile acid:sodium symporter family protein [Pseudomonadales bacterium]
MKKFIENHFNFILVISVVIGLTLPGIESVPNLVVSVLLGIIVFFLCAKISLSEIQGISVKEVSTFYLLRFILIPIGLFYLANFFVPQYAVGILLLALMPTGISTPVFVSTQKGNVSMAFALMLASSLLAPFVIPVIFSLSHSDKDIQILGVFYTLTSVILIPFAAYFLLTSIRKKTKPFIKNNSSFVSVAFMAVVIAIVISKQKDEFLTNYSALFLVIAILCLVFLFFYMFGWLFLGKQGNRTNKICYSLSSGATNTAIGINLALVYFSADTVFFMVLSELVWVLSIPTFNLIQRRIHPS